MPRLCHAIYGSAAIFVDTPKTGKVEQRGREDKKVEITRLKAYGGARGGVRGLKATLGT